jgi:hypothetical protein
MKDVCDKVGVGGKCCIEFCKRRTILENHGVWFERGG